MLDIELCSALSCALTCACMGPLALVWFLVVCLQVLAEKRLMQEFAALGLLPSRQQGPQQQQQQAQIQGQATS